MLDIKSFDDWSDSRMGATDIEKIKGYGDYLTEQHFRAGQPVSQEEIQMGMVQKATQLGLFTPDMSEEDLLSVQEQLFTPSNKDQEVSLLADHYDSILRESGYQDEEARAAYDKLALYRYSKEQGTIAHEQLRPEVFALLDQRDLVNQAKESAVDRGDLPIAFVTNEDGQRRPIFGQNFNSENVRSQVDVLLKQGAITHADLPNIDQLLTSPFGGANRGELARKAEFDTIVDGFRKGDPKFDAQVSSLAQNIRDEEERILMSGGEKAFDTAANVFSGVLGGIGEVVGAVVRGPFGINIPSALDDVQTTPDFQLFNDRALIKAGFNEEEIERYSKDYMMRVAQPAYRADRPETGITVDSTGTPIIANALAPNKELFQVALEKSNLNDAQKQFAEAQRVAQLDALAPQYKKLILSNDYDGVIAYGKAKREGKSDAEFVEEWIGSKDENYNWFAERAQMMGFTLLGLLTDIPAALAVAFSPADSEVNKGASDILVGLQKQKSDLTQYAQLMGDEYGLGSDIAMAIPQVAADIGLTIGTSGAYVGVKTALKGGTRGITRAAIKNVMSQVDDATAAGFRQALREGNEELMAPILREMGEDLAVKLNQVETLAPLFATSFARSSSASYGSLYSQMPDDLSHEEKHQRALKFSILTGLATGIVTTAMSGLNMSGVEVLATRVLRPLTGAADDVASKVIALENLTFKQYKAALARSAPALGEVTDEVAKRELRKLLGGAFKQFYRNAYRGARDEGIEESIDQFASIKIEEIATGKATPIAEVGQQIFHAFVIGGALGGGAQVMTQTFTTPAEAEIIQGQVSIANRLVSKAGKLRDTGSPETAAVFENMARRIDNQIRGIESNAKARQQEADNAAALSVEKTIDVVEDTEPMEVDTAPSEPFTPTVLVRDAVGQRVHYAGYSGVLEMNDRGDLRIKLNNPVEGATHVSVSSNPYQSLRSSGIAFSKKVEVLKQDTGSFKKGTPILQPMAKSKIRHAIPANPEITFSFDIDSRKPVMIVKNAPQVGNEGVRIDIPIRDPQIQRQIARRYGIQIPKAPAPTQEVQKSDLPFSLWEQAEMNLFPQGAQVSDESSEAMVRRDRIRAEIARVEREAPSDSKDATLASLQTELQALEQARLAELGPRTSPTQPTTTAGQQELGLDMSGMTAGLVEGGDLLGDPAASQRMVQRQSIQTQIAELERQMRLSEKPAASDPEAVAAWQAEQDAAQEQVGSLQGQLAELEQAELEAQQAARPMPTEAEVDAAIEAERRAPAPLAPDATAEEIAAYFRAKIGNYKFVGLIAKLREAGGDPDVAEDLAQQVSPKTYKSFMDALREAQAEASEIAADKGAINVDDLASLFTAEQYALQIAKAAMLLPAEPAPAAESEASEIAESAKAEIKEIQNQPAPADEDVAEENETESDAEQVEALEEVITENEQTVTSPVTGQKVALADAKQHVEETEQALANSSEWAEAAPEVAEEVEQDLKDWKAALATGQKKPVESAMWKTIEFFGGGSPATEEFNAKLAEFRQEEATTPTAEVDPIQAALAATAPTAPTPQPNPRVEIDGELVEIPSEMLPELVRTAREKNISIEKAFLRARAEEAEASQDEAPTGSVDQDYIQAALEATTLSLEEKLELERKKQLEARRVESLDKPLSKRGTKVKFRNTFEKQQFNNWVERGYMISGHTNKDRVNLSARKLSGISMNQPYDGDTMAYERRLKVENARLVRQKYPPIKIPKNILAASKKFPHVSTMKVPDFTEEGNMKKGDQSSAIQLPVIVTETGELLRGFFTNDPWVTAAQLDEGMVVVVPKNLRNSKTHNKTIEFDLESGVVTRVKLWPSHKGVSAKGDMSSISEENANESQTAAEANRARVSSIFRPFRSNTIRRWMDLFFDMTGLKQAAEDKQSIEAKAAAVQKAQDTLTEEYEDDPTVAEQQFVEGVDQLAEGAKKDTESAEAQAQRELGEAVSELEAEEAKQRKKGRAVSMLEKMLRIGDNRLPNAEAAERVLQEARAEMYNRLVRTEIATTIESNIKSQNRKAMEKAAEDAEAAYQAELEEAKKERDEKGLSRRRTVRKKIEYPAEIKNELIGNEAVAESILRFFRTPDGSRATLTQAAEVIRKLNMDGVQSGDPLTVVTSFAQVIYGRYLLNEYAVSEAAFKKVAHDMQKAAHQFYSRRTVYVGNTLGDNFASTALDTLTEEQRDMFLAENQGAGFAGDESIDRMIRQDIEDGFTQLELAVQNDPVTANLLHKIISRTMEVDPYSVGYSAKDLVSIAYKTLMHSDLELQEKLKFELNKTAEGQKLAKKLEGFGFTPDFREQSTVSDKPIPRVEGEMQARLAQETSLDPSEAAAVRKELGLSQLRKDMEETLPAEALQNEKVQRDLIALGRLDVKLNSTSSVTLSQADVATLRRAVEFKEALDPTAEVGTLITYADRAARAYAAAPEEAITPLKAKAAGAEELQQMRRRLETQRILLNGELNETLESPATGRPLTPTAARSLRTRLRKELQPLVEAYEEIAKKYRRQRSDMTRAVVRTEMDANKEQQAPILDKIDRINKFLEKRGATTEGRRQVQADIKAVEEAIVEVESQQVMLNEQLAQLEQRLSETTDEKEAASIQQQMSDLVSGEARVGVPAGQEALRRRVRILAQIDTSPLPQNNMEDALFSVSAATNTLAAAEAEKGNVAAQARLGLESGNPESVISALQTLAESGTPNERLVAGLLLQFADTIRDTGFVVGKTGDPRFAGAYLSDSNVVFLNLSGHDGVGLANVLLHEYLHAVTAKAMAGPFTAESAKAMERISLLRRKAAAELRARGIDIESDAQLASALSNNEEFLVAVLTNPKIQALIKASTPAGQSSLLARVVKQVVRFLQSVFGGAKVDVSLENAVQEMVDFVNVFGSDRTYSLDARREALRDVDAQVASVERFLDKLRATKNINDLYDEEGALLSTAQQDGLPVPAGVTIRFEPLSDVPVRFSHRTAGELVVNRDLLEARVAGEDADVREAIIRGAFEKHAALSAAFHAIPRADFEAAAVGMEEDTIRELLFEQTKKPAESVESARKRADYRLRKKQYVPSQLLATKIMDVAGDIVSGVALDEDVKFLADNDATRALLVRALNEFAGRADLFIKADPLPATAARKSFANRMAFMLTTDPRTIAMEKELGEDLLDGLAGKGDPRRFDFDMPIHSNDSTKSERFLEKLKSKFYSMPAALRNVVKARTFAINKAQAQIRSARKLQKLMEKAIENGASMDDVRMLFGTTNPSVTNADRKAVREILKNEEQKLKDAGYTGKELKEELDSIEKAEFAAIVNKYKSDFVEAKEAARIRLLSQGHTEFVEQATELRDSIDELIKLGVDEGGDIYLTRTYRFFTTEGWSDMALSGGKMVVNGEEVDFDLLREQAAKSYEDEARRSLKSTGKPYTEEQVAARTKRMMDAYLSKLSELGSKHKTIGSGAASAIRQDLNKLKPKSDINDAMLALLGEHSDPLYNALNTMQNVALIAANKKFQQDFTKMATALGLASTRPQGENWVLWRGAHEREAFGPMAGLYVDKNLVAALTEVFGADAESPKTTISESMENASRWLTRLSGVSVLAKTRYGVGYWFRNSAGGILLSTAQGIPIGRNALRSFDAARRSAFGQLSDAEKRKEYLRLIELGVANNRSQSRIVQDMMNGIQTTSEMEMGEIKALLEEARATKEGDASAKALSKKFGFLGAAMKGVKNVNDFLSNLDAAIENMYRINAYYYEKSAADKHFTGDKARSEEWKEQYAAEKVNRTFPGSSEMVDPVKAFQKLPLALAVVPFISWKSEVFRTMVNTPALAISEIKEGGVMARRGVQRLVGFSATLAFAPAIVGAIASVVFRALAGGEDEERELTPMEKWALRQALPNWQQGHSLYAHKLKDGSLRYIDMTYMLPHTQVTDPVNIIVDGLRTGKGVDGSRLAQYIASEWFGEQIAAGAVISAANNKDDFDRPIWLQSDPANVKFGKIVSHLFNQAYKTSAQSKIEQIIRSGEKRRVDLAIGEALGVRPRFENMDVVMLRGMQRMKREYDEVVREGGKLSSGKYKDEDTTIRELNKRQAGLDQTRQEIHNFMHVMEGLGAGVGDLFASGNQAGFSTKNLEATYAGYSEVWTGPANPRFQEKLYGNMSRAGEQEFPERIGWMNEWMAKHAGYHHLDKY